MIPNPYVGVRQFTEDQADLLFGREQEKRDLRDRLIGQRIVLLHSPSGAGKTSLIRAGLIPLLNKQAVFHIRPILRVNAPLPSTQSNAAGITAAVEAAEALAPALPDPYAGCNRYVLSVVQSIQDSLPIEQRHSSDELIALLQERTLAEYLAGLNDRPTNSRELLIFDQFEEILTTDSTDLVAKAEFFAQLGEALSIPERWALFAMRQDFVAALDPYLDAIPYRFEERFALEFLSHDAALQAIRGPAQQRDVEFDADAAQQLVRELSKVRLPQSDGEVAEVYGPYIEPVFLQVACERLWDQPRADASRITVSDIPSVSTVDAALVNYYEDKLELVVNEARVPTLLLRRWFDRQLITEQDTRGLVSVDHAHRLGVTEQTITLLDQAYLVRQESRLGARWLELAHDRLIKPIRDSNAAWRSANSDRLDVQAEDWDLSNRLATKLLDGAALRKAEAWAREHGAELTTAGTDFLAASQAAQRERRRNRFFRLGVALLFVAIGTILLLVYSLLAAQSATERANQQAQLAQDRLEEADRQTALAQAFSNLATSRELAAQSLVQLDEHQDLALLLSIEAQKVSSSTVEASSSLLASLQRRPFLTTFLWGQTHPVMSVAFTPDGKLLAGVGCAVTDAVGSCKEGEVLRWDAATHQPYGQTFTAQTGWILSMAFSPDGKTLLTGGQAESLMLWDMASGVSQTIALDVTDMPRFGPVDAVESVAYGDNGLLAAGMADGSVRILNFAGQEQRRLLISARNDVLSVAFSPDDTKIAAGSKDGTIDIWDVGSGELLGSSNKHGGAVLSLAFNGDGQLLASTEANGTVRLWQPDGLQQTRALVLHQGSATSLAFSPDSQLLASSGEDGTIVLLNLATGKAIQPQLTGHAGSIFSVAFSADGRTLASSGSDSTIRLWDIVGHAGFSEPLGADSVQTRKLAYSKSGDILAALTAKRILLWSASTMEPLTPSIQFTQINGASLEQMALRPDGKMLAASTGQEILLWDIQPDAMPLVLTDELNQATALAFSADGQRLAAAKCAQGVSPGCLNSTIFIWNAQSKQLLNAPFPSRLYSIDSLAFDPTGKTLLIGGCEDLQSLVCLQGAVDVLDIATLDVTQTVRVAGLRSINSLIFNPDGTRLAAGGCTVLSSSSGRCAQGTAVIWQVPQFELLTQLSSSSQRAMTEVVFYPDGRTLMTAGDGATILWDLASGFEVGKLLPSRISIASPQLAAGILPQASPSDAGVDSTPPGDSVQTIAISADGKTLATGWAEGPGLLWVAQQSAWVNAACAMTNRNLSAAEWQRYFPGTQYEETCPAVP